MYKYKNKTTQELLIPGVGVVAAEGEIDSPTRIENPNLELVSSDNTNSVVGTEAPQPTAVAEANKVEPNTPNLEVK